MALPRLRPAWADATISFPNLAGFIEFPERVPWWWLTMPELARQLAATLSIVFPSIDDYAMYYVFRTWGHSGDQRERRSRRSFESSLGWRGYLG